jgi:NAD-dependent deacetylase
LPYIALDRKIPVIEINPDETPFSRDAEFVLRGPSGEILPQLVQAVRKLSAS